MPLKLPRLPYEQKPYTPQIVTFGGVNYSQNHRDGELEDCRNLSSREYPCLSQRPGRTTVEGYESGTAVYAHGKLLVVDGNILKCDGKEIGVVTAGAKEFAVVNTKIIIWPDKIYVDMGDPENISVKPLQGHISGRPYAYTGGMAFRFAGTNYVYSIDAKMGHCVTAYKQLLNVEGKLVGIGAENVIVEQLTEEQNPNPAVFPRTLAVGDHVKITANREICVRTFDASGDEVVFGETPAEDTGWYGVVMGFGTISITNNVQHVVWFLPVESHKRYRAFEAGERVTVAGLVTNPTANTEEDAYLTIASVQRSLVSPGQELIQFRESFSIGNESGTAIVEMKFPNLSHICGYWNRLWGTESGVRIWGSALGDPKNFYTYDGASTDSYAVAVGSDGDFTGCIGYGGNVLFWKEDKLHKLLGTAPENYQLYEYTVRGLMDGCHKSQVIINETLFFKSRDGVCAYTGSVPSLISENFGVRRFRDAAAGTDGEKYYVSMQDTQTGAWGLWVYDPATGIWLQEDAERVLDFANLNGTLYMLMDGGRVLMTGQTDSDEEIEWEATFCEMTEQHHERKCYSRLLLRMDLEPGAFCRGEISTDGGRFREVGILHGARNKTGEMLVQPTNCDRFQVRISGRGRCRLKSLIREFTFGGER